MGIDLRRFAGVLGFTTLNTTLITTLGVLAGGVPQASAKPPVFDGTTVAMLQKHASACASGKIEPQGDLAPLATHLKKRGLKVEKIQCGFVELDQGEEPSRFLISAEGTEGKLVMYTVSFRKPFPGEKGPKVKEIEELVFSALPEGEMKKETDRISSLGRKMERQKEIWPVAQPVNQARSPASESSSRASSKVANTSQ